MTTSKLRSIAIALQAHRASLLAYRKLSTFKSGRRKIISNGAEALVSLIPLCAWQKRHKETFVRAAREYTAGEFACPGLLSTQLIVSSLFHEVLDLCPLRIC